MMRILTFGSFDLFHYGHLRLLQRAHKLKTNRAELWVGVSTDEFHKEKKKELPVIPYHERVAIVDALSVVDHAFPEETWETKMDHLKYGDVLVMGSDWVGKFDKLEEELGVTVIYLPRTVGISTTQIKKEVSK